MSEVLDLPYARLRSYLARAEGRDDGTGYAAPTSEQVDMWIAKLAEELRSRADAVDEGLGSAE